MPCPRCFRPLDDGGVCICAKLPSPAVDVQDVTLFLGGTRTALTCTTCGRAYTFISELTTVESCYFCLAARRLGGA